MPGGTNQNSGKSALSIHSLCRLIASIALGLTIFLAGCLVVPYRPTAEPTKHDLSEIPNPERIRLSVSPRVFLEKMAKDVLNQDKRLQQVDGQTFIDTASPEQELTLARLMDPATQTRIEPLKADYLVLLGERKDVNLKQAGGMFIYIGFYGLGKSKKSTTYWAAVIDLRKLQLVEQLTSQAMGTDAGAGLFYGLFVVSDTNGSARNDVTRHIVETIVGAQPAGPIRVVFVSDEPIPTAEDVAKAEEEAARLKRLPPRW